MPSAPSSTSPQAAPPAQAIALFHGLLLAACPDGEVNARRLAHLDGYCRTLADLGRQSFDQLMAGARRLMADYASLPESVAALTRIESAAARARLFVLAVDLTLAAGEGGTQSDEMLAELAERLGVSEEAGAKILAVLQLKHQG